MLSFFSRLGIRGMSEWELMNISYLPIETVEIEEPAVVIGEIMRKATGVMTGNRYLYNPM